MKLETILNVVLVALVVPVIADAICTPVISKYFMGAANVETIASAAMVSQAITMLVAFVGCWGSGLKIFIKLFYPMWMTEIAMAIIIAMLGSDHIELRFYLDAIQNALCVAIVSQSIEFYSTQVIPRDRIQIFINKQRTVVGAAGIIGSFFAVMLGNIDIHIVLWADVAFSMFGFALDTFVLNNFKRLMKESKNG